MFKKASKIFSNPHHSSTLSVRGLIHVAVATLAIGLLFFVFKPFGLKNLQQADFANVLVTLSGISFIMMAIPQFIFPYLFKDFYAEEKWTTGKQLVQLLIMAALICVGTTLYLAQKDLASFPLDALLMFGLALIPLIIWVVIQQNLLDNKFRKLAEEKNQDLKRKAVVNSENPLNVLSFKGLDGKVLNLIPNQLIYIDLSSEATFYFQQMIGVDKNVIRISKAEILNELKGHPQFESFGNNYIVNVNAIQKIGGTARGYDIQIARINEMVKVSHKDKKKIDRL